MIRDHWLRVLFFPANVLGLALLLLTWLLGDGGFFLLLVFFILLVGGETAWRFRKTPSRTPYLGMLLTPLLLLHYSSVGDFRIRLACLVMLLYILVLAGRGPDPRLKISLAATPPWRIWLLAFLVFALTAVVFHARGIQLSGDEPHYLMMSQSLVEDGDLDLKNNLQQKTYLAYLPVELRFHGLVHDGKYHSFHLPGISFLMVPGFFLFRLLNGAVPAPLFFRLCAAFLGAFFALGLWQALRTLLPDHDNSMPFVFFLTTFPLVFHAVHLYPELPAATLMIYAYLFSQGQRSRGRDSSPEGGKHPPRHWHQDFLPGLLLAFIPWLHLKYVLPAALLAVYVSAGIWRRDAARIKRLGVFFAAPFLSLVLLELYSKMLYGSFNPGSISPEKNFFSIPLILKVETLLSFFLDQRDGLLVYAPFLLLLFLVLKKETRARIRDLPLLAAIFISYLLSHAYTTVRGGYSPAARPTLFVFWIMAVFAVAFARDAGPGIRRTWSRLLAGLTIFATVWLFYYPLFLYQPVTREVSQRASGLLSFMSSEAIELAGFFPSFLKMDNSAYLPNWIWLGALSLALAMYYAGGIGKKIAGAARWLYPVAGTALLAAVCFFPHVQLQTRYSAAGLSFYCNSKNFSSLREASAFRFLAGRDYDLFFDLKGSAATGLSLSFSAGESVALTVRNGVRTLLRAQPAAGARLSLRLRDMRKLSLGKRELVHLGIETKAGGNGVFVIMKIE